MDIIQIGVGAGGAGLLYFVYLAVRKGIPAAIGAVTTWWKSRQNPLAALEDMVNENLDHVHELLGTQGKGLVALHKRLAAAEEKLGIAPPAQAAPAPAAPAAAEPDDKLPSFLAKAPQ